MLLLPLYFISNHLFALKLLAIINFGNLETFIYWLLFKSFIERASGGLLSAFNTYISKIIYFFQAMAVYLHLLACFLVVFYEGDVVEKTDSGHSRVNGEKLWSNSPHFFTYLHYFEFGLNAVINKGSSSVTDGSTLFFGLMFHITFLSSGLFVISVLLICGLIMALNKVEGLTQDQKEEIDNWFFQICTSSGGSFSRTFEKQLFRYFDFVQNVSVTDILEEHAFYRQLATPLQESLKAACALTLSRVFVEAKEDYSEQFLAKLILLCKPMA